MESWIQDCRFSLRTLGRRPAFALVIIATVALAAGANTAVFTLLSGAVLRPLPLPHADRLAALVARNDALGIERSDVSLADLRDLRAQCTVCEEVAGYEETSVLVGTVPGGDWAAGTAVATERMRLTLTSPSLFRALGVAPMLGRAFTNVDEDSHTDAEVLLGHALWQERFGADRGVVGGDVMLDGEAFTVVGVMPPGFRFPERADLFVPLVASMQLDRSARDLDGAVALLPAGNAFGRLDAELRLISERLSEAHPATNDGWTLEALSLRDAFVSPGTRAGLGLVTGAVLMVLLIACANIANLLLSREAGRRHEVAIRTALGGSRWRIVRQLLTESVLLALVGGAGGLLVAAWCVDYIRTTNPTGFPYWLQLDFRLDVLAFSVAVALVAGVLFGAVPALRAARSGAAGHLRSGWTGGGASRPQQRLQRKLVVAEIALSLVLVFAAGLLIASSRSMMRADPGFDTEPLVSLKTMLVGDRYADPDARLAFFERAAAAIESMPGVEAATFTGSLPIDEDGAEVTVATDGTHGQPGAGVPATALTSTDGFFHTLDVPIEAGRSFTRAELRDTQADVAVINRALADRLWPEGEAVGHRFRLGDGAGAPALEVIGVVRNLQYEEFGGESLQSRMQIHLPYARLPWRGMTLIARTVGEPARLAPDVRRRLLELDPTLPVYRLRTLEEVRYASSWGQRILGQIFGAFALTALMLGAVGVHGVMAFAVAQRRGEIGVRMAVGADRRAIASMVLRDGLRMAAVGIGGGLLVALAVRRLLATVVWGVDSSHLGFVAGAATLLFAVVLLACLLPARRAATADPATVLRAD